jgi:hypothetical protein
MAAKPRRKTKRGGRPGNTNAVRHGFYGRKFQDLEVEDFGQVKGGLQDR